MRLVLIGLGRIGAFPARTLSEPDVVDSLADATASGWIAEAAPLSRREHRPVRIEEVRNP